MVTSLSDYIFNMMYTDGSELWDIWTTKLQTFILSSPEVYSSNKQSLSHFLF